MHVGRPRVHVSTARKVAVTAMTLNQTRRLIDCRHDAKLVVRNKQMATLASPITKMEQILHMTWTFYRAKYK